MNTPQVHNLKVYTDEEIMELFQGGYEEAFTELMKRYKHRIHNFIFNFTKDELDSEDIVQETFFRVYKSRHSYERIAKFSTWLYTIASNLVKSHYRKSTRYATRSIVSMMNAEDYYELQIQDGNAKPDEMLDNKSFMQCVEKSLEVLPAEFKDLVILRDLRELSYEEIMDITGLPMGTVKSRINRGRARLYSVIRKKYKIETI